jgi:hypothetical protein
MSICIVYTIKYTMQFLLVFNLSFLFSLSLSLFLSSSIASFSFRYKEKKTFICSWKMCHGSPTCSVFIGAVLLQVWSCRLSYLTLHLYNIERRQVTNGKNKVMIIFLFIKHFACVSIYLIFRKHYILIYISFRFTIHNKTTDQMQSIYKIQNIKALLSYKVHVIVNAQSSDLCNNVK